MIEPELYSDSLHQPQDMVNKYAKDNTAQKYSKAVTKVNTVVSDGKYCCSFEYIFSMQYWILGVKKRLKG
jgi:hypothetical protein